MLAGALGVLGLFACSTSTSNASGGSTSGLPDPSTTGGGRHTQHQPTIRVVFRAGKVYAREGDREWPIAEVGRDEMLWAPDGYHFAYVKLKPKSAPASQPADGDEAKKPAVKKKKKKRKARRRRGKPEPERFVIVVRTIRGDSINEFGVYRPGRPSDLDWIDNDRIGYLAPPDKSGDVYVLHTVESGDILRVFRGKRFIWAPGRKHLAYITGGRAQQSVRVNQQTVWPRDPPLPVKRRRRSRRRGWRRSKDSRHILGDLVWSPDGSGLAFMEQTGKVAKLVVLLVLDNRDGDLSWPLPSGAIAPNNRLFWAKSKVIIGTSVLKPRFAASWKRLH